MSGRKYAATENIYVIMFTSRTSAGVIDLKSAIVFTLLIICRAVRTVSTGNIQHINLYIFPDSFVNMKKRLTG